MRDGDFTFYRVQHKYEGGWCDSDLSHFLFAEMSFEKQRSAGAERMRIVLHRASDLFQVMGEHGFLQLGDARDAHRLVAHAHPDREFRLVRIHQTKSTEAVEMPSSR